MTPTQPVNQPTPLLSDMTSPYRGLSPYTEADAAYFFGRTTEIATITANLEVTRFTLFYGPSGVGKSSVLRAGVIHQLTQRAQETFAATGVAEQIPVYFSRWASDPLLGLSQALAAAVAPYVPPPNLPFGGAHVEAQVGGGTDVLSTDLSLPPLTGEGWGGGSLLDQLHHWSQATGSELLLVLDQFEEFFQYHVPQPGATWDPTGFGAQLVQIINHSTLPVNVLLSLREDALARLDYFQGRIPGLLDNRLSIGHLDRAAGAEAVTQPLAQFNREHGTDYRVEEPLTAALLDQVAGGQVGLSRRGSGGRATEQFDQTRPAAERIEAPYLQLVLTRLWQQERENGATTLRLATLNGQLGGAETIVRNYLDDTLDALPMTARDCIARVADHLVTLSGTKIALTLGELAHYAATTLAEFAGLAQQLQERRLLRGVQTPNGVTQYEIFHDVLGPALLDWQGRYQKQQEEQEARRTQATGLSKTVELLLKYEIDRTLSLPLMLAIRAVNMTLSIDGYVVASADHVLQEAINAAVKNGLQMKLGRHLSTNITLSATYSPNGHHILTAGDNKTVYIWDAATGEELQQFIGHSDLVLSAAYSPDGRYIVTASQDNTAGIWNANSGQVVHRLEGHTKGVNLATYSPNGQHIASASADHTVCIWDAITGREVRKIRGHTESVLWVNYRSDSQYIVSASDDFTVRIWDAATGSQIHQLSGHTGSVLSSVYSPDGQHIVSASADQTVRIWDATTGREVNRLIGHTGSVLSAVYSPDSQYIASAGEDFTIRLWNATTGSPIRQFIGHTGSIWSVGYSSDGQHIVSASDDSTVRIWNAVIRYETNLLTNDTSTVNSAVYSPDGRYIISAGVADKTVRVWDATTGKEIHQCIGHKDAVRSANYSPNGQYIVSASVDKTVRIWDATTGKEIKKLDHTGSVQSANYSPDGQYIVSGGDDFVIRIWDATTCIQMRLLKGHTGIVWSVIYSPDGQYIVSASDDKTINIWDTVTGKKVSQFVGHTASVRSANYSPDGQHIVSASADKTVRIWDPTTGKEVRQLTGHTNIVQSANYSPDGQHIVSASADKTVRIWDATTGKEVRQLTGHRENVLSAVYSPNGQYIVSASADRTIRFWIASIKNLLEQAQALIQRDKPELTDEEYQQFGLE